MNEWMKKKEWIKKGGFHCSKCHEIKIEGIRKHKGGIYLCTSCMSKKEKQDYDDEVSKYMMDRFIEQTLFMGMPFLRGPRCD